jgi:putative FmdB family regulatory protein
MPIFEYTCKSCGAEFEKLMRASTVLDCPSCNGTELDKKLSVFATAASSDSASLAAGPSPCDSCGHAGGPGSCAFH